MDALGFYALLAFGSTVPILVCLAVSAIARVVRARDWRGMRVVLLLFLFWFGVSLVWVGVVPYGDFVGALTGWPVVLYLACFVAAFPTGVALRRVERRARTIGKEDGHAI